MILDMLFGTNKHIVERGSSVVDRESPGSNPPFATVSKFGHFRSLHDASVNSAVQMDTWLWTAEEMV